MAPSAVGRINGRRIKRKQNVVWFNVPMQKTSGMNVDEGAANVGGEQQRQSLRQWASVEQARQWWPSDELDGQVM